MIRKIAYCAALIFLCIMIGGCWSYRGLDQLSIVAGLAIDRDQTTGMYQATFEIVDLTPGAESNSISPKVVESEGKTVFDAARNAKKRLLNKLYLGNTKTIVISQQIAREIGVTSILEGFLRDPEPAETINLVISQQETAKEVMLPRGVDINIVSYQIHRIIEEDWKVTASTKNVPMHQAFNSIKGPGNALVLPAVHLIVNDQQQTVEVNGLAVFKKDKLIDFLTAEQSHYYLFITDNVKGGALGFSLDDQSSDDTAVEILSNKTRRSCTYDGKQVTIRLEPTLKVGLIELETGIDGLDETTIKNLEKKANAVLTERMLQVLQRAQYEFCSDIFGFGAMIYQRDPVLWYQIADQWDMLFQNAKIEITPTVRLMNTGLEKQR